MTTVKHNGHIPNSPCPSCGHKVDPYRTVNAEREPKPGDAYVCLKCACVLVFNDDFTLRQPTMNEMIGWPLGVMNQIASTQEAILKSLKSQ